MTLPDPVDDEERASMIRILTFWHGGPSVCGGRPAPTECIRIPNETFGLQSQTTPRKNQIKLSEKGFTMTLGAPDIFPIEILSEILRGSVLTTVLAVRSLNRRARLIVDDSIPFKYLALNTAAALRILVQTNAANYFTLGHIYDVLCTPSCSLCGLYAGFVWLPSYMRCCVQYLLKAPKLMPMTATDAKAGEYGVLTVHRKREKAIRLLSPHLAREVALKTHGGEAGLKRYIDNAAGLRSFVAYKKRQESLKGEVDPETSFKIIANDITRLMVSLRVPYYNTFSRTLHPEMLGCTGCQTAYLEAYRPLRGVSPREEDELIPLEAQNNVVYTEDSFFEHAKECARVQFYWNEHLKTGRAVPLQGLELELYFCDLCPHRMRWGWRKYTV